MITGALDDEHARWRRSIYVLLVATSVAAATGRILAVRAPTGESPMLSANDRSRWCTVRSLVDHGTYAIDRVIEDRHPETKRTFWRTIDMVRHRGPDGIEHYYSSKPPLLATILAGEYWLIQRATGASIAENPFYVMRLMLILTNGTLLLVYFATLAHLLERYGQSNWGRVLAMAAAAWGTFLTTFAVTLNNHLPAAVAVVVCVAAVLTVERGRRWQGGCGLVAGLAAAMAAANELPALSLVALVGAALAWQRHWRALAGFTAGAAIVAAAFFGTNYWAHQSWRPPYAHRSDGPVIATLDRSAATDLQRQVLPPDLERSIGPGRFAISENTQVEPRSTGRWVIWDPPTQSRLAVVDNGSRLEVRAWDDWYDYETSYWNKERQGVDRGEPSRAAYAVHITLGHHGIFSLTPLWILSVVGCALVVPDRKHPLQRLAIATAALTAVCLVFYIARPLEDRNYGGVSSGFRWTFWFIPLWLLCLLPAADRVSASVPGRAVAVAALAASAVSAAYASMNPWVHPWLYEYWMSLGWVAP